MRKVYKQPTIEVEKINPCTALLADSYGKGIEVTGVKNEPGGEEYFW